MKNFSPSMYQADILCCPGDTIRDILDDLGMTQAELAERLRRPTLDINEILNGKSPITIDWAKDLEFALGLPASFWMQSEANYRLALENTKDLKAKEKN